MYMLVYHDNLLNTRCGLHTLVERDMRAKGGGGGGTLIEDDTRMSGGWW